LCFFSLFALAFAADKGEALYSKYGCYGCHGAKGEGSSSYPKLAGKSKMYLIDKLKAYRAQKIKSKRADIMVSYAKPLSDEEIKAIAQFLKNIKKDENEERYQLDFVQWGDDGS